MIILEYAKPTHSFIAQSGVSQQRLNNQTSTTNTQQDNKTQIEKKSYYIHLNNTESNLMEQFVVFIKNKLDEGTQEKDKGIKFLRLYENKDSLNPLNQSNTTAYTLHTGKEYGDYKGIDLAEDKDNELVLNALQQNNKDSNSIKQTHSQKTKNSQGFFKTLEALKDDRGRIMIKIEVVEEGEIISL